ncbi:synapse differentiation-inducing gene protein 1-like [Eublepharis macularius]|uniref:Synapse differentiation-inducing gene protein 1-like n=1 Tax=Eublepharis macularius TaxID=481883 RepID=A0AA97LG37_EUBMA|nr:synapse differentiation-inducing gene protein 1-like [Eublepharis macularius]
MEENQGGAPSTQNPPPYSEKQPYVSDQQQLPVDGPAPPLGFVAYSTVPNQYQPYYSPYGAVYGQGPITHAPQHTTFIVPVQPTHEPDYLGYSIFTMLCCCLPLGIAALVYSIQTREANRIGDGVAARQNSRMAQIFAHTALGVGLVFCIIYIVFLTVGF